MIANEWEQCVMSAISAGDLAQLDELLKGVDENQLDFDYCDDCDDPVYKTPLTQALYNKQYNIAEKLLCAGAGVDTPDGRGNSPLIIAVREHHNEICHLLVNHGANVNACSRYNALHFASAIGNYDAAVLLLEAGAQVFTTSERGTVEYPAVRAAISSGHSHILKLYLEHCEKVHSRIPLEWVYKRSFQCDKANCAIIALKAGYFPLQNTEDMFKPYISSFQLAALNGSIKLMNLLVELKPQFLEENWLIEKLFSIYLFSQHSDYIMCLLTDRKQVPSLVKLCRTAILAQLGMYYIPLIKELPLPKALMNYLEVVKST